MSRPAFTPEQRAAIRSRSGASLLAANAGSGKTAVMVERFAEAVRIDGVPVGAILALTFTEKAAGEFGERLKRRLTELGELDHARAVDAAWIGTIHGFCARVLRARPLAAGLDPNFTVLDEPAASRVAAAAYEDALNAWGRTPAAIDLAASYGPALRDLVLGAYASLRARGSARPRLSIPASGPPPDATTLAAAAEAALEDLKLAGAGMRVSAGRDALVACRDVLATVTPASPAALVPSSPVAPVSPAALVPSSPVAPASPAALVPSSPVAPASPAARGPSSPAAPPRVPWPGELDAAELKRGAKALESVACESYRDAWAGYRSACAAFHARSALQLIDGLLDRFGGIYEAAKAERAAVDFEDLELRVRDLLTHPAVRERWAERFQLLMVDEFQDTNGVQLEILEALERDNLFAVGDEFQSIYRFRHADVGIFRARAATLGHERVHGLAVNFRSREELLDVLNAAFAPELGERFSPLKAGRVEIPEDGVLRLFEPGPPAGEPPVELLVTDTKCWGDDGRLGLAAGGDQPWRRAEARLIAHRLREEVEAGRRPGECVVLVRATGSLRLLEQALEEQGLPTYVVGGRGYWSQEQVRDGLAWLRVLANPRDEAALLTVLASPFCGAGADALILLAAAGREQDAAGERRGLWNALQEVAEAGGDAPASAAGGDAAASAAGGDVPASAAGGDVPASTAGGDVPASTAGGDAPASTAGGDVPASTAGGDAAGAADDDGAAAAGRADPGAGPRVAGALASRLAVVGAAELARIAGVVRLLASERARAERAPLEVLLERAIAATGYDLAVLARPGGDRRLANLRKLMRLAREFERAEGRDLRGFLADAAARDLAEAREGEAALESEGLDAVRLMTIHRAKGLEFPVVCVADLGRKAGGQRSPLLVGADGAPGLRLYALGGGDSVPTPAWERLALQDAAADAEEERRLFYVAMTRARELLILSGGTDTAKWPASRPGGPPIDWIARAVTGDPASVVGSRESRVAAAGDARAEGGDARPDGAALAAARGEAADGDARPDGAALAAARGEAAGGEARPDGAALAAAWGVFGRAAEDASASGFVAREWAGRPARVRTFLNTPDTLPPAALEPRSPARATPTTSLPAVPVSVPKSPARPRPMPQRLSFTQVSDYARCGYSFYLRRILRLPRVDAPPPLEGEGAGAIDPRDRGTIVHSALEDLDFADPRTPDGARVLAYARRANAQPTAEEIDDIRALVAAFAGSPLTARLAAAKRVRREAAFSFALEPDGAGPLVSGLVDVLAEEHDGTALVIDYKSNRLQEGDTPERLVEREYETQRIVYALAALRAGAPRVEVLHCVLERIDEPVVAAYTAADAPELAGRLQELATGILEHDYPVTPNPHRDLCAECPGRAALCRYPESRTLGRPGGGGAGAATPWDDAFGGEIRALRPLPDASRAAPARRT